MTTADRRPGTGKKAGHAQSGQAQPVQAQPGPAEARPARRWRPSALIRLSFVLHALGAVALPALVVARPDGWPLAAGVIIAALVLDHVLLTLAGLWPRSRLLGPNLTRAPQAVGRLFLTLDDGPDPEVTPQVLDLLARHGARASFFVIASRAQAHPMLVRRMAAEGHRVENHSFAHGTGFSFLGTAALERELGRAQAVLASLAGRAPRFFRAPAGLRNPLLEPVLCRLGLTLAAWTRRGFDTRCADAPTVLNRLAGDADGSRLADGDILLLHDGHAARDAAGNPVILHALPALLEACARRGLAVVPLDDALAEGRTDDRR
jgi:peptidoglycan-N-acetylglucosamine deacetylase